MPPPQGDPDEPLQALIIDSWFDNYLGVVSLVRVVHGRIAKGDRIVVKSVGRTQLVDGVGCFSPKRTDRESLGAGEVGYVVAGIKEIRGAPVGDTIVLAGVSRHAATARLRESQAAGLRGIVSGQLRKTSKIFAMR